MRLATFDAEKVGDGRKTCAQSKGFAAVVQGFVVLGIWLGFLVV